MSDSWIQVFYGHASVYALDEYTKEWADRGTSGKLIMFQSNENQGDVRIKWEKNNYQTWWRLTSAGFKQKGERALVVKAWTIPTNKHEILAIRFIHKEAATQFANKYRNIFPNLSIQSISQPLPPNPSNYFQNNDNNIISRRVHRSSNPPPPPPRRRKLPPPPPPARSNYIHNGQIVNDNILNKKLAFYELPPQPVPVLKLPISSQWKCPICTYENKEICSVCSMCGLYKKPDMKDDDDDIYENPNDIRGRGPDNNDNDINKWKCRKCTFSNHTLTDRCEICRAKRYIESEKQQLPHDMDEDNLIGSPIYNSIPEKKFVFDNNAQNQQSWNCPLCTLSNSYNTGRCEACNTDRHNANPYHPYQVHKYEQEHKYDPLNAINNDMIHDGVFEATLQDFSRAASDIACCNDSPYSIFSTLRSVAKKLLKDEARYRILDATNPKVMERLIGFRGVLHFLGLLGFESDALGMKLICQQNPPQQAVYNAITVLTSYQQRFRITDNGMNGNQWNEYDMKEQIKPNNDIKTKNGFDDIGKINNNENLNDLLALEQIILWSTHENMQDTDTMETLIMTHKMFTDSLTLLKQLRKRFSVPIPCDILNTQNEETKQLLIKKFQTDVQKRIHLMVIKALRDWMKRYWAEDFDKNEEVQFELKEWLKELSVYNKLDIYNINCVWIGKLHDAVKREYLRLNSIDWDKELEKQMDILSLYKDIDININDKINTILSKSIADELADQITLMDYRLFSRIEPREFVHQRWKDPNNKRLAPNVLSLIQQFNNLTIFIQIQILREKSLKKRATAIKRIIKMGEHFKLTRNYNSLCAVFSALNAAPIYRLKLAWNRVPERNRLQFDEWSVIFCRDFNYKNLRQLLRKAGGNPCIPHIGVFLQDLIYIDEVNKKKINIKAFNDNLILNFNKCVRIADRIKNLQLFQYHKYNKKIKENKLLQKLLLIEFDKLKDVTEDQIWDMSTEIKKQDQRENKPFFAGF